MPCSDSLARDFMDDHRVRAMDKEIRDLSKVVEKLKQTPEQVEYKRLEDKANEMADRLNRVTSLLCEATWELKKQNLLNPDSKLGKWYEEHTNEDLDRMLKEFEKIKTIGSLMKWVSGLNEKERYLFEHKNIFKNLKIKS